MINSSSSTLKIHPHFKMIFQTVIFFIILSVSILGVLTYIYPGAKTMNEMPILVSKLVTFCEFGWQAGLGAVFGLLGGNATSQ